MTDEEMLHAYMVDERTGDDIAVEVGKDGEWVRQRLRKLGAVMRPRGYRTAAMRERHRQKTLEGVAAHLASFEPRHGPFLEALKACHPCGYNGAYRAEFEAAKAAKAAP